MGDQRAELQIYESGIKFGRRVAALLCVAGVVLSILGLTGNIEWLIELGGLKSKLVNASPGVFFTLLGGILLYVYKPKLKWDHKEIVRKTKPALSPSNLGGSGAGSSIVERHKSGAASSPIQHRPRR